MVQGTPSMDGTITQMAHNVKEQAENHSIEYGHDVSDI